MVIVLDFSNRMNGLSSSIFAQLESHKQILLAAGREVFDFSTGTPDLPPAPHIVATLQEAAGQPENYKYALRDLPELTDAVKRWYTRRYGVDLETPEILGMMGSQEGLSHIALTIADPDDLVLVPDPGYPIFSVGPSMACARLHKLPLLPENDFLVDFDSIDPSVAHAAKLIILSYPSNPLTAVAPPSFYEKLVWFARKYEIRVVHDNAYSELTFGSVPGGSFLSTPGAKDVGVEFNSLSKSYNMTGCRISFAVGNREMVDRLRILKSHLDYGIFLPVQKAAIAALTGPQDCVADTVRTYQERGDVLVTGLQQLGWKVEPSAATMFVWAPIPPSYTNSVEFTFDLLDRTGVIVIPGTSFGSLGEGYVRWALVQPVEKIQRALSLMRECGMA